MAKRNEWDVVVEQGACTLRVGREEGSDVVHVHAEVLNGASKSFAAFKFNAAYGDGRDKLRALIGVLERALEEGG